MQVPDHPKQQPLDHNIHTYWLNGSGSCFTFNHCYSRGPCICPTDQYVSALGSIQTLGPCGRGEITKRSSNRMAPFWATSAPAMLQQAQPWAHIQAWVLLRGCATSHCWQDACPSPHLFHKDRLSTSMSPESLWVRRLNKQVLNSYHASQPLSWERQWTWIPQEKQGGCERLCSD